MSDKTLEGFGYERQLKQALSFRDLVIYGMLFMVPVAPIAVFGFVAHESHGMVPLVYLVGCIGMFFTALSYARFSSEFPIAGSVYAYIQRGINHHIGFIGGWTIFLDYIFTPALCFSLSAIWINSLIPAIPIWGWIVIFVLFNTLVNYFGVEVTARANMILLGVELICLFCIIVYAIKFILSPQIGGFIIAPIYQPGNINLSFIAMAASIAVLGFLGFDGISTLSEEAKDTRHIPKAIVTCLLVMGAIFIIQTYLASVIAIKSIGVANLDPELGYFQVLEIIAGPWLKVLVTVTVLLGAAIANASAAQAAMARILFSMSRDKLIPGFFNKIHDKYKTPTNSILFVGAVGLIVAIAVNVEYLIKLVNFGALTSFMMLNLAVIWYFFGKKGMRSGMDILKYIVCPLLGFSVILYVWMGFDPTTKVIGLIWMGIGIIYGAIKSKGYKEIPDALKNLGV